MEDGRKELMSGDNRIEYEVAGLKAFAAQTVERGSFFLGQCLWGFSHIGSGLGVGGVRSTGVSNVGEMVWEGALL